jgi:hypothetical protein
MLDIGFLKAQCARMVDLPNRIASALDAASSQTVLLQISHGIRKKPVPRRPLSLIWKRTVVPPSKTKRGAIKQLYMPVRTRWLFDSDQIKFRFGIVAIMGGSGLSPPESSMATNLVSLGMQFLTPDRVGRSRHSSLKIHDRMET